MRLQLSRRFPLFYPIDSSSPPVSFALLLEEALLIMSCMLVLRQLMIYRSTKHIYQGFSIISISVLSLATLFAIFTYICACHNLPEYDSGKFGVFYLEHINYLWIMGNGISAFKYVPQLSLNWMGSSTRGLSSKYIIINSLACLIMLMSNILPSGNEFYEYDFNACPCFVTSVQFVSLCGILYQAQSLYWGKRPYLPRGELVQ